MTERTPKTVASDGGFGNSPRLGRPFWLPVWSYYGLTACLTIAFFFLVLAILHDGGEDLAWGVGGIGALIIVACAAVLREFVLRGARTRMMLVEKNFDRQLNNVYSRSGNDRKSGKLSIEQNEAVVREIKQKSEAAKVLGKFAAGHREVFELCDDYLARNESELRQIGVGSPRLASLRKGKERVSRYHRFHILQWAEIEARGLTVEAKSRAVLDDKVEAAQRAINVIEEALTYYPNEGSLIESHALLEELLTSIKVSNLVEIAELATFKGEYSKARGYYRDALFYLGRNNIDSDSQQLAVRRIQSEIEKLRMMEDGER